MTAFINKEEGDRILTDFLVEASKENGTKECAEESYKIMGDFADSQLVLSIIIAETMLQDKKTPKEIIDFEIKIMSALTVFYSNIEKSEVPHQFKNLVSGTEEEVMKKVSKSNKLRYAIRNFVSSFYHYQHFENKYPEITKML